MDICVSGGGKQKSKFKYLWNVLRRGLVCAWRFGSGRGGIGDTPVACVVGNFLRTPGRLWKFLPAKSGGFRSLNRCVYALAARSKRSEAKNARQSLWPAPQGVAYIPKSVSLFCPQCRHPYNPQLGDHIWHRRRYLNFVRFLFLSESLGPLPLKASCNYSTGRVSLTI